MSGALTHSPAQITREVLVHHNLGTHPDEVDPTRDNWPVYASGEPPTPDNCITVYDTQGIDGGRTMSDGERQEHNGVQIRVRSIDHETGFTKARQIAVAFDESMYDTGAAIGASSYNVHSYTRTGDVIPLGKATPNSKCSLFTINALISVRQL
jgi:hypothetical protein